MNILNDDCRSNGKNATLPPTAKQIARAALRRDYEEYLRHQRGLSERTIFHCWRFADRFLEFRFGEDVGDLSEITAADIARFLHELTTSKPPFRDKTPATHLRNFFRYLFKNGQILNNILKDAFVMTGLKPPAPYVGSHILRHSLAVNLVRQGASLEEIGDMLRHRSRQSTMIYARLDIDGLRSLAQPWPVAGGAQ